MRYHLGLGVGHLYASAHLSTSSYRSMSIDAQDELVPESLPIGRDVRTTDVADNDDDESDNSEMSLEDREGWMMWRVIIQAMVVTITIQMTMTTSSPRPLYLIPCILVPCRCPHCSQQSSESVLFCSFVPLVRDFSESMFLVNPDKYPVPACASAKQCSSYYV
jgi:hypothetical protein